MKPRLLPLLILLFHALTGAAQPHCTVRTFNVGDGLPANIVTSMTQDKGQLMWFSTWNGLCCYDGYRFTSFRDAPGPAQVVSSNRMKLLEDDSEGNIWCVSYENRLYVFDTGSCRYIDVSALIEKDGKARMTAYKVYCLPSGVTWISGECGGKKVYRISGKDITGGKGIEEIDLKKFGAGPDFSVKKIVPDAQGNEWILLDDRICLYGKDFYSKGQYEYVAGTKDVTWIATPGGALYRFDKQKTALRQTPVEAGVSQIGAVTADASGRLILGTEKGLVLIDGKQGERQRLVPTDGAPVTGVFTDARGRIWSFGQAGGLTLTENGTAHWVSAVKDNPMKTTTSNKPMWLEDRQQTVWAIPPGGTFSYYDERAGVLRQYVLESDNLLIPTSARKHCTDRQGNLWIIGAHETYLVNFTTPQFLFHSLNNNEEVRAVCAMKNGDLWIGSIGHFFGLKADGQQSAVPVAIPTDEKIYAFLEDSKGRQWIGTKGGGLYLVESGQVRHFTRDGASGLSDDNVYDFDEDPDGNVWIALYGGGVNKVTDAEGDLRFVSPKGYPKDKFRNARRVTHTPDGTLLVSTTDGLVTFRGEGKFYTTAHVQGDTTMLMASDVMQTLVTKSGRVLVLTLSGGLQEILEKNLLKDNLKCSRNLFTAPQGALISMAEDLKGRVWVVGDNTVTMLNPETKERKTYGRNYLGDRAEFTEAEPSVNPTTGEVVLGAMSGFFTFHPDRLKTDDFRPEIAFIGIQYQGEQTMHPLLNTKEVTVPADKRNFTIVFSALDYRGNDLVRYAYRVKGVDQEWNYSDEGHSASYTHFPAGHYTLEVKSTNADGVWTDNVRELHIRALPAFWESVWGKLLKLLFVIALIGGVFYFYRMRYRNKMDQRLLKLKTDFFTEIGHKLRTPLTLIGGPVTEVLDREDLSDKGRDDLEMVQRNSREMLDLVNRMIEHEDPDHYIVDDETAPVFTSQVKTGEGSVTHPDTTILVVEDNDDLRAFLASILGDTYHVLTAENGKIGLEKAQSEMPDFILTDVMMPEMDGLSMVRQIKQDKNICHIPIVVLSAKASLNDRLEGLSAGIDDYITKPFSATYLRHRVENIISQRHALQESMIEQLSKQPEPAADGGEKKDYSLTSPKIVDADQEMMQTLMAYLEAHIGEENLRVEDMADAVNLGRTVFYGKLKSIVGMSPVDFIKHLRMQRAEELIAKSHEPFSQIAYSVGFSNPKYFSKCFKKETGLTPSEYRAKAQG